MRRQAAFLVPVMLGASFLVGSAPPRERFSREDAESSRSQPPLFREVAAEVDLKFDHVNGATGQFYLPEIMGAGVAVFDYDSDGDLDVYCVQGQPLSNGKESGPQPGNRLFRNELVGAGGKRGTLRFTDVTREAGVDHRAYGMGVAVGDYDNDGDVDFYLTNFGSNALYRNEGNGRFTDVTSQSGTDDPRWSTSASFFDYDRDGDLDLFVLNYIDFTLAGNKRCFDALGVPDYCNPNVYRPLPDRLFRNDGGGKFTDVSEASGIASTIGPGLGVATADVNADGWLDVYVANDGTANFLWMNRGDGTFEENALLAGAAFNIDGIPEASMGVTLGDFDNDADEDIFLTHLTGEKNTLYVNDGSGNFADESHHYGVATPSIPFNGFGTDWFDFDNDGYLDLFIANGAVRRLDELRGEAFPYHQKNQLYKNLNGTSFKECSVDSRPAFDLSEVSRGAAFGDIDNDGDLDIMMTNNNGPARLFINQTGKDNHWLAVRLQARVIEGSRVGVRLKSGRTVWRRCKTDGSYLSANDPRVHFGLGAESGIEAVTVQWPGGAVETWGAIKVDSEIVLRAGTGRRVTGTKTQDAPER